MSTGRQREQGAEGVAGVAAAGAAPDVENHLTGGRARQIVQAGRIDRVTVHEVLASRRMLLLLALGGVLVAAGSVFAVLALGGGAGPGGDGRDEGSLRAGLARAAPHKAGEDGKGRDAGERRRGDSARAGAGSGTSAPHGQDGAPGPAEPGSGDGYGEERPGASGGGADHRDGSGSGRSGADSGPDAPGSGSGSRSGSGSGDGGGSGSGGDAGSKSGFAAFKTMDTVGPEVVNGAACGAYSFCAYRAEGHRQRYDFRAPDATPGRVCWTLPPGAPAFVSVVNGRGHHFGYRYFVYEKPRCGGERHLLDTRDGYQDHTFTSYAKT